MFENEKRMALETFPPELRKLVEDVPVEFDSNFEEMGLYLLRPPDPPGVIRINPENVKGLEYPLNEGMFYILVHEYTHALWQQLKLPTEFLGLLEYVGRTHPGAQAFVLLCHEAARGRNKQYLHELLAYLALVAAKQDRGLEIQIDLGLVLLMYREVLQKAAEGVEWTVATSPTAEALTEGL